MIKYCPYVLNTRYKHKVYCALASYKTLHGDIKMHLEGNINALSRPRSSGGGLQHLVAEMCIPKTAYQNFYIYLLNILCIVVSFLFSERRFHPRNPLEMQAA